jgi:hypothetical protein
MTCEEVRKKLVEARRLLNEAQALRDPRRDRVMKAIDHMDQVLDWMETEFYNLGTVIQYLSNDGNIKPD